MLIYLLFLIVGVNMMNVYYTPLHCETIEDQIVCQHKQVYPTQLILHEIGYIFFFIFSIGPIRLFFKIKEGKTSIQKIKEGYEDQRGFGPRNERRNVGLLPTTTRPQRR